MTADDPRPSGRVAQIVPEEDWDGAAIGTGVEPPDAHSYLTPYELVRSFSFVDLCGFTRFTAAHGPAAATEVLMSFRHITRQVAARRGVRVAKWLGDGVLLVGVDTGPLVAATVEVVARVDSGTLGARAGVATGPALLFDGDDYVGRVLNLASRLCDVAESNQVLADRSSLVELPDWVEAVAHPPLIVRGVGRVDDVVSLRPTPQVTIDVVPLRGDL